MASDLDLADVLNLQVNLRISDQSIGPNGKIVGCKMVCMRRMESLNNEVALINMSRASLLEKPVIVVEVAQKFWIWALRVQERTVSTGRSELQMLEENDDLGVLVRRYHAEHIQRTPTSKYCNIGSVQ